MDDKQTPKTVYREDPDGSVTVVGCIDDFSEFGEMIYEDRQKIDWEPKRYYTK